MLLLKDNSSLHIYNDNYYDAALLLLFVIIIIYKISCFVCFTVCVCVQEYYLFFTETVMFFVHVNTRSQAVGSSFTEINTVYPLGDVRVFA